jgi:PAS domain-containing protein
VTTWRFGDPGLLDTLESGPLGSIDDLRFGLIVMDRDGRVTGYNRAESELSGLPVGEVTGGLDEQMDYVFTYRMSPTPVRLR